jgi:hypothetical protein
LDTTDTAATTEGVSGEYVESSSVEDGDQGIIPIHSPSMEQADSQPSVDSAQITDQAVTEPSGAEPQVEVEESPATTSKKRRGRPSKKSLASASEEEAVVPSDSVVPEVEQAEETDAQAESVVADTSTPAAEDAASSAEEEAVASATPAKGARKGRRGRKPGRKSAAAEQPQEAAEIVEEAAETVGEAVPMDAEAEAQSGPELSVPPMEDAAFSAEEKVTPARGRKKGRGRPPGRKLAAAEQPQEEAETMEEAAATELEPAPEASVPAEEEAGSAAEEEATGATPARGARGRRKGGRGRKPGRKSAASEQHQEAADGVEEAAEKVSPDEELAVGEAEQSMSGEAQTLVESETVVESEEKEQTEQPEAPMDVDSPTPQSSAKRRGRRPKSARRGGRQKKLDVSGDVDTSNVEVPEEDSAVVEDTVSKDNLEMAQADTVTDTAIETEAVASVDTAAVETPVPTKTRGRPRKTPATAEESAESSKMNDESVHATRSAVETTSRRRGRKKKVVEEEEVSERVREESPMVDGDVHVPSPAPASVGKTRGRPKKVAAGSVEESEEKEELATKTPPAKSRGRPRKETPKAEESEITPKRQKGGRKRKGESVGVVGSPSRSRDNIFDIMSDVSPSTKDEWTPGKKFKVSPAKKGKAGSESAVVKRKSYVSPTRPFATPPLSGGKGKGKKKDKEKAAHALSDSEEAIIIRRRPRPLQSPDTQAPPLSSAVCPVRRVSQDFSQGYSSVVVKRRRTADWSITTEQSDHDQARMARFAATSFKVDGEFSGAAAYNSVPNTYGSNAFAKRSSAGESSTTTPEVSKPRSKKYVNDSADSEGEISFKDTPTLHNSHDLHDPLNFTDLPSSPSLPPSSDSATASDSVRRSSRPVVPSQKLLESSVLKRRLSGELTESARKKSRTVH